MKRTTLILLYATCLAALSLTMLTSPAVTVSAAEQPSKDHLKFEMLTLSWDTYSVDAGYAIEAALDEIGIDIVVKELDDDIYYPQVYENGYYDEYGGTVVNQYRDYEIYEMSSGFSPTPTRSYLDFHSTNDYPWGDNHAWFHNTTMDTNLDNLMSATSSAAVQTALNNIQQIAAENLPVLPLFISTDSHLVRDTWEGFVINPGGILTVWNIWSIMNMTSATDDTFDMAYPSAPSHFNPFLAVDARSGWVHALVYEPLVYFDEKGLPIPWLAESFTPSTDGLSTNFTIRDGVKWHDGTNFTAEDVKFSLDLYSSDEAASTNVYAEKIASVEIGGSDNRTVIVTRTEPQAWTTTEIGGLSMLQKATWEGLNITAEELDDPASISSVVGTGPFKYVAGAEGGPYTFDKNPYYWYTGNTTAGMPNMGSGKALAVGTYPSTDHVKIWVIDSEDSRVEAIQNGDADSERYECSNAAIETVSGTGYEHVKVINAGASRWDYYMTFNTALKPLDDLVVRQAIAHALDLDAIAEAARGDYAVVSESVVPESFFPGYYNPNVKKYSYNVELANKMLDDAGYEDVDDDGVRDIPGWEEEDSPGFELILVLAGMLAAIPLIRKKK
ncbi:MAG: ABC transporter substrate-binding protein [Candidatus Thorarchaeota archaeon]